MIIALRLLAVLMVVAIAGGVILWMLTGDRRPLRFAIRGLQVGLFLVVLVLLLLAAERIIALL